VDKLGIIVLGQTPRPDLESLFRDHLPGVELAILGALDGKEDQEIDDLSKNGEKYPLLTILADGTTREISLYRLLPHIQKRAEELTVAGARMAVLFCAGNFPDIKSPIPMLFPGRIIPAIVQAVSKTRRIGIVIPNKGQLAPAMNHWRQKGFSVEACVASPKDKQALHVAAKSMSDPSLELVVLDCMGFSPKAGRLMRRFCGRPVICPQSLVAKVTAEMMGIYKAP